MSLTIDNLHFVGEDIVDQSLQIDKVCNLNNCMFVVFCLYSEI